MRSILVPVDGLVRQGVEDKRLENYPIHLHSKELTPEIEGGGALVVGSNLLPELRSNGGNPKRSFGPSH